MPKKCGSHEWKMIIGDAS